MTRDPVLAAELATFRADVAGIYRRPLDKLAASYGLPTPTALEELRLERFRLRAEFRLRTELRVGAMALHPRQLVTVATPV